MNAGGVMVKILEVCNLNYKSFENFNVSFESNTFYSIVGGNNSGKTLLFKLITGLIKTSNCITCSKIMLNDVTRYEYIKKIGVVESVNKKSFIYKKVIDELMFPLHNLNYYKGESLDRINYILEMFGLEEILKKKIKDLSIYEQQKLLIVIALLHKPKVLVLDSVFDIFSKSECFRIINVLRKFMKTEKIAVINFTSNLDLVINTKIMLLKDFKIINNIENIDLYENDKMLYENGLEIPFIVDLSNKLRMYNVIDNNYDNVKDMVNDIWQ